MICGGCGGIVGRDCFNPQECEWIAQDMAMRSQEDAVMREREREHYADMEREHDEEMEREHRANG